MQKFWKIWNQIRGKKRNKEGKRTKRREKGKRTKKGREQRGGKKENNEKKKRGFVCIWLAWDKRKEEICGPYDGEKKKEQRRRSKDKMKKKGRDRWLTKRKH